MADNNRDVVLFNGNDSNIANSFDALGWNITLAGITYESGTAQAQFHVSDGQRFPDDAVTVNSTVIAPAGPVFEGSTVPSAGRDNNGLLWDIRNFNVTSLLSPGTNSLNIRSGQNSDRLSCVLIAIDLPAGAAHPRNRPRACLSRVHWRCWGWDSPGWPRRAGAGPPDREYQAGPMQARPRAGLVFLGYAASASRRSWPIM